MKIDVQGVSITLTKEQSDKVAKYSVAPKYDYPMWFESRITGAIVKFTALSKYTTITAGIGIVPVGHDLVCLIAHTDTTVWKQIKEPIYYPPKGTVCIVWDAYNDKKLRVSNGEGEFYYSGFISGQSMYWKQYKELKLVLTESDYGYD